MGRGRVQGIYWGYTTWGGTNIKRPIVLFGEKGSEGGNWKGVFSRVFLRRKKGTQESSFC